MWATVIKARQQAKFQRIASLFRVYDSVNKAPRRRILRAAREQGRAIRHVDAGTETIDFPTMSMTLE